MRREPQAHGDSRPPQKRPHATPLQCATRSVTNPSRDRSPEKLQKKLKDMEEDVAEARHLLQKATSAGSRELYSTKLRKAEVRRAWLQDKLGLPVDLPGSGASAEERSTSEVLLEGFEGLSVQSEREPTQEERVEMEAKYGDKPPEELQKWSGVAEKVILRCEAQLNDPDSLLDGMKEELLERMAKAKHLRDFILEKKR